MINDEWKGRELEIQQESKEVEHVSDCDSERKDKTEKRRNNSSVFGSSKGFEKTANGAQTNFFKRSRQRDPSTGIFDEIIHIKL